MNDTFHRFLDLPWELRDMIWNFAIRPALPGVHIFNVYHPKKDDGVNRNMEIFHPHECYDSNRLAAPRSSEFSAGVTEDYSNPSTYLIDGGLWSACKESRLVMKRKFSGVKGRTFYDDYKSSTPMLFKWELGVPATGYFTAQHGDVHYLTVFPHRDLFILRPQNMDTIDWDDLTSRLPLASATDGLGPARNIALEYNAEWGFEMIDKLFEILFEDGLVNFWIFDRRLRRRHSEDIGSINFMRDVSRHFLDYEELSEEYQGTTALIRIGLLGCDWL
ncbi:uncharacterized protein NECHADRAFT_82684 [Fusarium vanettenii 77-13-4]|uniref:2EXR domain-containing protein n=1 Tax=Fusarium vanettenii (strain ATCC MYA-4622 / CBS 123669 / FGSC 9596 / NRRL 45880 / 77-13-4) TaxID=660122 RepID=C7YXX7_FUSV7|nr:uncharacterized protein NECHADRAFT_82684 [Fusarium vanettenii 77-13-4]EEU43413.1 hypothetical protein NECHADRAFT_82684 [Fusarium vanettenii 77-13-4]